MTRRGWNRISYLFVDAFKKALPTMKKVRETYADQFGDLINLEFAAPPVKRAAKAGR